MLWGTEKYVNNTFKQKNSKCNSFQVTSDLLKSENLKVAIAQLYHEVHICNFTML